MIAWGWVICGTTTPNYIDHGPPQDPDRHQGFSNDSGTGFLHEHGTMSTCLPISSDPWIIDSIYFVSRPHRLGRILRFDTLQELPEANEFQFGGLDVHNNWTGQSSIRWLGPASTESTGGPETCSRASAISNDMDAGKGLRRQMPKPSFFRHIL